MLNKSKVLHWNNRHEYFLICKIIYSFVTVCIDPDGGVPSEQPSEQITDPAIFLLKYNANYDDLV